jgi:hypothetical protein
MEHPFGWLYNLERGTERVPLGAKLRTFLSNFRIAPLIRELKLIA